MNPEDFVPAIKREIIERKPQNFKINTLNQIKSLFSENPFHSGFGNRETVKNFNFRMLLVIDMLVLILIKSL